MWLSSSQTIRVIQRLLTQLYLIFTSLNFARSSFFSVNQSSLCFSYTYVHNYTLTGLVIAPRHARKQAFKGKVALIFLWCGAAALNPQWSLPSLPCYFVLKCHELLIFLLINQPLQTRKLQPTYVTVVHVCVRSAAAALMNYNSPRPPGVRGVLLGLIHPRFRSPQPHHVS